MPNNSCAAALEILTLATQPDSQTSRCDKIGGTLAYTSVEIKTGDRLVALGRHTKFVRLAHKTNAEMDKAASEATSPE